MVELEIPVGLIIERLDPSNSWGDHIWLPAQVLPGVPDTTPWTILSRGAGRVRYFAGVFTVKLYSPETGFYRDNLTADSAKLWVAMRPEGAEPPFDILAVTADPTEGEGYTETGTNIVETIAMPEWMAAEIAAFIEAHHVERVFEKRKRDKRLPDVMGRRRPLDE